MAALRYVRRTASRDALSQVSIAGARLFGFGASALGLRGRARVPLHGLHPAVVAEDIGCRTGAPVPPRQARLYWHLLRGRHVLPDRSLCRSGRRQPRLPRRIGIDRGARHFRAGNEAIGRERGMSADLIAAK